jgi:hypothetical protein
VEGLPRELLSHHPEAALAKDDHDGSAKVDQPSADAGCAVDWSWLEGRVIESATSDLQHWHVRFTDGETLTIQAADYQGKPFLAFKPYKAPTG